MASPKFWNRFVSSVFIDQKVKLEGAFEQIEFCIPAMRFVQCTTVIQIQTPLFSMLCRLLSRGRQMLLLHCKRKACRLPDRLLLGVDSALVARGGPRYSRLLDRCAGDEGDVGAMDAHVGKFAVRQAVQFAYSLAVFAPVIVRTHEVHGSFLSSLFQHLR
jgi:hypothetical protein